MDLSDEEKKKVDVLRSRYYFLKLRIEADKRDLSYDRREAAALRWVLALLGYPVQSIKPRSDTSSSSLL